MRSLWMVVASVLLLFVLANTASVMWRWGHPYFTRDPLAGLPRVFLWAWERPENLKFLDPAEAGVAVLAKTLILSPAGIASHPRVQPIELPPGIKTIAVVRIEKSPGAVAGAVTEEAVRQILSLLYFPATGIQVDFDAGVSDRQFYRELLDGIRRRLPRGKTLSITALASWCIYDDWISDLPVDESIPMLFRLGIGEVEVKRYLTGGNDFRTAKARSSVGISMDELPVKAPGGRRVYVFNPRPWTRESVNEALKYVREWR
jgi:hypothetical protein